MFRVFWLARHHTNRLHLQPNFIKFGCKCNQYMIYDQRLPHSPRLELLSDGFVSSPTGILVLSLRM